MNMQNLMAQAQKIQKDMKKKQEEIYNMEFEGKSEWVDILLTGDKKIKAFKIKNKENITGDDIEMLEDMVKIAFNEALDKIDKEYEKKMAMYSSLGGLM